MNPAYFLLLLSPPLGTGNPQTMRICGRMTISTVIGGYMEAEPAIDGTMQTEAAIKGYMEIESCQ